MGRKWICCLRIQLTRRKSAHTWPAKTDLSACTGRWLRTADTFSRVFSWAEERTQPAVAVTAAACWSWECSAEFPRRQYLNPLSFQHARRLQGSTSQNTNTYYILRTRAEGIRPPAKAGPRMLPDRSLDRVVEGRIGLENEAYGRLARGVWIVVALCAHLNNSENERHEEIFPYRQLLTRSFWYCAFVHAFTSGNFKRHRPSLRPWLLTALAAQTPLIFRSLHYVLI